MFHRMRKAVFAWIVSIRLLCVIHRLLMRSRIYDGSPDIQLGLWIRNRTQTVACTWQNNEYSYCFGQDHDLNEQTNISV